jgi:hypothetical protein
VSGFQNKEAEVPESVETPARLTPSKKKTLPVGMDAAATLAEMFMLELKGYDDAGAVIVVEVGVVGVGGGGNGLDWPAQGSEPNRPATATQERNPRFIFVKLRFSGPEGF